MDERVCRFGGSVERFGGSDGSKLLVVFTLLAVSAVLVSALLAAFDQSALSASSVFPSVGAVIESHLVVVNSRHRVGSATSKTRPTSIPADIPVTPKTAIPAVSTVDPVPAERPAGVHTLKLPLASLLCVHQSARVKRIVLREEQSKKQAKCRV